jgi:hypothetical protein
MHRQFVVVVTTVQLQRSRLRHRVVRDTSALVRPQLREPFALLVLPPLAQQQRHVPLAVRISIKISLVKAAATPVRWVLEQTASLARLLCQTVSVNLATILQVEALLVLRVPPASTSTPLLPLRPKTVVREDTARIVP